MLAGVYQKPMKQRVTWRVYAPCLSIDKAYVIAHRWTENVLSTRRHKKCCIMRARAGHPRREFPSIITSIPRAHVTYRSQSWAVPTLRFSFCERRHSSQQITRKRIHEGIRIQMPWRQKVRDNTYRSHKKYLNWWYTKTVPMARNASITLLDHKMNFIETIILKQHEIN